MAEGSPTLAVPEPFAPPPPYAGPADVLALFAHPDDETFGPGATLAQLARRGHTVALWCATRGEAGSIGDSPLLGRRALGALRERELHEACSALGIETPTVLYLPDGGLARLDPDTLLRPFVRSIRLHRPRVLVTFHPNGVSGHSDHRTVTRIAAGAFAAAADAARWPELGASHQAERLWGYAVSRSRAERITYRKVLSIPDEEADARVDTRAGVPMKHAAVDAHASQKPFIDRLAEFLGGLDDHWSEEVFTLVASRAPLPAEPRPIPDLFHGLGE